MILYFRPVVLTLKWLHKLKTTPHQTKIPTQYAQLTSASHEVIPLLCLIPRFEGAYAPNRARRAKRMKPPIPVKIAGQFIALKRPKPVQQATWICSPTARGTGLSLRLQVGQSESLGESTIVKPSTQPSPYLLSASVGFSFAAIEYDVLQITEPLQKCARISSAVRRPNTN